jgi:hypothetical protein
MLDYISWYWIVLATGLEPKNYIKILYFRMFFQPCSFDTRVFSMELLRRGRQSQVRSIRKRGVLPKEHPKIARLR